MLLMHYQRRGRIIPLVLLLVVLAGILLYSMARKEPPRRNTRVAHSADRPSITEFRPIRLLQELPAIQDVPVLSADEVEDAIQDAELVIGVVVNGESRAYPINMLTGPSREIINDTVGGRSIAATW